MRVIETVVYNYEDMIALEDMSPEEVKNTLSDMYRGWFNRYVFPKSDRGEYSEEEYDTYKIQCAFRIVHDLLDEKKQIGVMNND